MKKTTALFCVVLTSCSLMSLLNVFAAPKSLKTTEEYTAPVITDNLAHLKILPKDKSHYKLIKIGNFNPDAEGTPKKGRPFELRGSGGSNARVVNKNGKTVFVPAEKSKSISSIDSSPDGKRTSVSLVEGDGAFVIEPDGASFTLPTKPPGEHKFPFDVWRWIDNDTLVSMSGDEKLDANGNPVKSEANVAQMRIYIYSISRNELSELELPGYMKNLKMVQIVGISAQGYVHLMHDDANATLPSDLGWFEIKE